MNARGLDLSYYNNPSYANLQAWRGLGFCIGFYRTSIGRTLDPKSAQHHDNLHAAGYLTAPYHALHEDAPIDFQVHLLLTERHEDDIRLNMIDLERPSLTGAMIRKFFTEYDRLTGDELWVYTNSSRWYKYFPARQERLEFLRYGLYVAGYPHDRSDYDQDGNWQGQLMDPASVALRSNPPIDRNPDVPHPWTRPEAWQHSGHGRLPGYDKDLDLSIYPISEDQLRAKYQREPMLKLGPHHLQGGHDTERWIRDANPTVAKAVGDFGPLLSAGPATLTVGRMVDDGQLDGQGFDVNRYLHTINPLAMASKYMAWLSFYMDHNPQVDVWEGPNEQVIRTPEAMAWYAHFLNEFARLVQKKGKRAGIGGWAVGNPLRELNLWPHYVWALQACRDYGAILTRHEYGPLDGYNSLRYRYDNMQFTLLGYPKLPIIVTECGADDAGGMRRWKDYYHGDINRYWNELVRPYALALQQDDFCLGATLFCVGDSGGWDQFDVDGTGLVDRVIALARETPAPPVEDDDMDEVTRRAQTREKTQQAMVLLQAVLDLNQEPVVAPAIMFRVKIIYPSLNVRSGPGVAHPDVGDVLKDQILDVYANDPTSGWYRISAPTAEPRWISGSAQYSVRV